MGAPIEPPGSRGLVRDLVEARREGLARQEEPRSRHLANALADESHRLAVGAEARSFHAQSTATLELLDQILRGVTFDLHGAQSRRGGRAVLSAPPGLEPR